MTMWYGKLMKENEMSRPTKIILGTGLLILFGSAAVVALQNAAQGVVNRPWAFAILLIGFLCFLFPKLSVLRNQKLVSLGTHLMTEDQANFYRVGYYLMGLGFLFTFL